MGLIWWYWYGLIVIQWHGLIVIQWHGLIVIQWHGRNLKINEIVNSSLDCEHCDAIDATPSPTLEEA